MASEQNYGPTRFPDEDNSIFLVTKKFNTAKGCDTKIKTAKGCVSFNLLLTFKSILSFA